ncbi:MAG: tetratricopeptide repeat protein, partial [Bacteroidales bacterium]|nr:tetratricopeptide repeat protein [Bacteroidales bacterium]
MIYPSVGQYTEAIKLAEQSPEDYFATKTTLRPVLGADGNPVMSSGNFAVVFKMQDQNNGKIYALKCFTRDQEGRNESYRLIADELQYVESEYLTKIQYLENELFVDTGTDDTEFPVLLMDWVEGETLDKYIKNHINEPACLEILACDFAYLSDWLLKQSFAHGDLKPDNIIVKDDGSLVIVDYDGIYVPKMRGQKARELGSPDFRHPQRTKDDFDEHIDDFAIVTLLLTIKAIALNPNILEDCNAKDCVLLHTQDFTNLAQSIVNQKLQELIGDKIFARIYAMFVVVLAEKVMDMAMMGSIVNELNTPEMQYKYADYFYSFGCNEDLGQRLTDFEKTKYYSKAVKYYTKAAERDYVKAQKKLGDIFLEFGDDNGCFCGMEYLMEYYGYDEYDLQDTETYEQAIFWYKKAAKQGDVDAQMKLVFCYENGIGVSKNRSVAEKWFAEAAECGDAEVKFAYAERFGTVHSGSLMADYEWSNAVKLYTKAAELGHIKAQIRLGELYYYGVIINDDGERINIDIEAAIEWWTKAAEQGDVESQYEVGRYYNNVKDYQKAVKWLTKAAEQGDVKSQYELGRYYDNEKDYQKAVKWWTKAAEQGDVKSQYELGRHYENEKDCQKAVEWYTKVAGHKLGSILQKVYN